MALSDLFSSAVANWPLDEASGSRADTVGSSTLTDNNTVASTTGLFGTCADFEVGNSEFLSAADSSVLSVTTNITWFSAWVTVESDVEGVLLSKWSFGTTKEYNLRYVAADNWFSWTVLDSGVGNIAVHTATVSTGTRYHLLAYINLSALEIGVSLNGSAFVTTSITTGPVDTAADFYLGHEEGGGADYFDGTLEDVSMGKGYQPVAQDAADIYDGGAGRAFSTWGGGGPAFIDNTSNILKALWGGACLGA